MRNFDEAIRWHREVVRRQPKNAAAYANLGAAHGGKGQNREEIENYQKAIALNPRDPVVYFNLGAAYEKEKREADAARLLDRMDRPDASIFASAE